MATSDNATTERPSHTTFHILEATDETLKVWAFLGFIVARDREHALRLYFPDPETVEPGVRVAVSVNAWRPVPVGKKPVKPRLEIGDEVQMPGSAPPEPATANTTVTTVTTPETTDEPTQLTSLEGGKAAASA